MTSHALKFATKDKLSFKICMNDFGGTGISNLPQTFYVLFEEDSIGGQRSCKF